LEQEKKKSYVSLLKEEELRYDLLCNGCMLLITLAPFYSCVDCDFFLHEICAKLPIIKQHRLHHHVLTLVSHVPSKCNLFECNACNYCRHGFIYKCDPTTTLTFNVLQPQMPLNMKVNNTPSGFIWKMQCLLFSSKQSLIYVCHHQLQVRLVFCMCKSSTRG
jgi:hypothetical protein